MRTDIAPSTYHVGLALCFILTAYIFYHLGCYHPHLVAHSWPKFPWLTTKSSPILPIKMEESSNLPDDEPRYIQGVHDGTQQAFLRFDYHDMKREVRQSRIRLESREKELKIKIAEVEAQEKKRQKWFEENVKEIKSLREQQIASAWNQKQEREKGIFSWLRVGARRRTSSQAAARRVGTPALRTHQQSTIQSNNGEKGGCTILKSEERDEKLDTKVSVWLNEKGGGIQL